MSNKQNADWVSACMDGQLGKDDLMGLSKDHDAVKKWSSYHLIGDTLRNDVPDYLDIDLSNRVAMQLKDEPHYFKAKEKKGGSFFRQLGQVAIAATVATIAVVGVQNYEKYEGRNNFNSPVLSTTPLIGTAAPVSLEANQVNQGSIELQQQRINSFFQDHNLQQKLNSELVVEAEKAKLMSSK